ncbi:hydroxymethylbilane synthase [Candidatus Poriferisocius sp.]|uniref:hydroxymethylbilane synthase n=1 Tax=Candidatus Poriferisocius sp. TaxID=3101276 RepID=UPI003B0105D8
MLRAATRGSALARWQAAHVADLLGDAIDVQLLVVTTTGDRRAGEPISSIGGKGVFVKEVQAAVLDGRADLAVHSAKDLPATTPDGLVVAAVPPRADPRDALVGSRLDDLPPKGLVATGSARRRVQLRRLRPDLRFAELRGNIDTRLAKVPDYHAVIMAKAALDRLGEHPSVVAALGRRGEQPSVVAALERLGEQPNVVDVLGRRREQPAIVDVLDCEVMVPQVGQGALAVECREGDDRVRSLLAAIEDPMARRAVDAERAFLSTLGGDCTLPAGAHARILDNRVVMRAVLAGGVDGRCHTMVDEGSDGESLGQDLARRLLAAAR